MFGLIVAACSPGPRAPASPITVFAAASLTDALGKIAAAYETATSQAVRLSFGASGAVARQVQAGAPADLVVLADPVWMDRLQASEVLAPDSRIDLVKNRLVLIAPVSAAIGADPFAWLSDTKGKLVIGDPDSVPAGNYARTWLRKTGRWNGIQPSIVTAADVRSVRTFVERGEAGLGVIYRSDTVGAPGVKIVGAPAAVDQPTIIYPAAMTRNGAKTARGFMDFLRGPEAARIFAAHGFDPVP